MYLGLVYGWLRVGLSWGWGCRGVGVQVQGVGVGVGGARGLAHTLWVGWGVATRNTVIYIYICACIYICYDVHTLCINIRRTTVSEVHTNDRLAQSRPPGSGLESLLLGINSETTHKPDYVCAEANDQLLQCCCCCFSESKSTQEASFFG